MTGWDRFDCRGALLKGAAIGLLAVAAMLTARTDGRAAGPVVLQLKARATVSADVVRLRDVAVAVDAPLDAEDPLWRTQIAKAPPPADTRRISRDLIRLRLKQLRRDADAIRLQGPDAVEVRRSFVAISTDKLRGIVVDFLNSRSYGKDTRLKIEQVHIRDRLVLPEGEVTYQVRSAEQAATSGLMRLWIQFYVNGRPAGKLQASARVALYRNAVVARRIIGRYKPITVEDVAVKVVDIAGEGRGVVSQIDAVLGQRSRRTIYPGTVIESDMIEVPPVVKRGDLVMIVAESNGLRISALGEVRKQGRPGDRVRVVNLDSRQAVYARVVDSETVQVDF